jgi:hypothetical protein
MRRRQLAGLASGSTLEDGQSGTGNRYKPGGRDIDVDAYTGLLFIIVAASVGIVGTLGILFKQRKALQASGHENPYAVSTEGMKRCPACNTGNLVTDATCSNCGKPLPG